MSRWAKNISIGLFILFLGSLCTWFIDYTIAQKEPEKVTNKGAVKESSTGKIEKDTSELLASINRTNKNLQYSTNKMKEANEEDRLVIQLQIFSLQQQIMDDAYQLAIALVENDEKDKPLESRQQVEEVFSQIMPRLWFQIKRLRDEIDLIRAHRIKAKADERLIIENEVAELSARLNIIFELSLSHIENMEKIGMNTSKARINLTKLLAERSDELSGRIMLATNRINTFNIQTKDIPGDADATKLLIGANKNLNTNTTSMAVILELMETLELDTNVYRSQLIETTRDITSGVMSTGVIVTLVSRAMERGTSWFFDSGPKVFLKLLLFFGILILFFFAKRLVAKGLDRAINTSNLNLSQLAHRIIISTVSNLVMVLGLLIALSQIGISLGPLLAGLGVVGFIIGFALQDTLSNFASGIMILLYRPYDVEDLIEVGGVSGKVDKMNLVSTSVLTLDNQMIVIPNNKIWGDVIINITAQDIRRVDMVFGIAYSDDVSKAEVLFNNILKSQDKVLKNPDPVVRLHTLGASSVDFIVRPWVNVDDYWDVYWEVTRAVKIRFDEEKISIPFPQRDVHIYHENKTVP
jgi:small conductance mechanosensitive channel